MAEEYKLPYSGADIYRRLRDVDTKAIVKTMTSDEYESLGSEGVNANTLYMITDLDDNDNQIYVQNEEPTNVDEGTLWLDMDEEGATSGGSGGSSIHVGTDAPTDGSLNLWIDTDDESAVGGSGGVSSWNDLTDRPFGDFEVILPETVFQYDSQMGLFYMPGTIDFRYGETYIVNWNGVEHTVTATIGFTTDPYYGTNDMPIVVLGNPAPLGGPDGVEVENNGLPFAIASVDYFGVVAAIPLDGSTAITISIYSKKKLDPYWDNGAYILNIETTNTEMNDGQIPFTGDTTELAMAILNNRPIHVHLQIANMNNGVKIGQSSAQLFATAVTILGGEADLKRAIVQCIALGLISTIPYLRIDSLYLGKPIFFYSDHTIST